MQYELQSYFFPQNHPVIKHYFHFFCFIPNPFLHFCPPSCFQALCVLLVIGGGGKNSRGPERYRGAYVSNVFLWLLQVLKSDSKRYFLWLYSKEITNNSLEVGEYFPPVPSSYIIFLLNFLACPDGSLNTEMIFPLMLPISVLLIKHIDSKAEHQA